nr:copia protein [Tanacetum cinerariifolium]
MFGECSCSCIDGILDDGASWSIDVDTGESAKSTALGTVVTGTGETAIVRGLKYSSNIGFDLKLLVEHFNLVGDNTGVLESDVVDDSTWLMLLKDKLKTLKEEKEGVDGKLASLLKASKDLDNLIESQRPSPTVESTSGDDQNINSSTSENGESTDSILSKPVVKFVKAAKRACFNCGHFDHLSYDCGLGVKKERTCPTYTHKSITPRPGDYKPYRPPMRPMRSNMNDSRPNRTSFYKPAHSYNKRPFQETTQNLVAILIQSVKRLERELKARTPIQKVDRGRSRPVVWTLVDCPKGVRPIGTKWVLKNKKDERGIVIKNKARLVAQGHTQEERIDYDEVFAPVTRIEAIRLFLAYASFMGFTVYQMDVKCNAPLRKEDVMS